MHIIEHDDKRFGISFHHEGKRKQGKQMFDRHTGKAIVVGCHPKRTECTIFILEGENEDFDKKIFSKGSAQVATEISEAVPKDELNGRIASLGARFIRTVRVKGLPPIVTYRGDNFSYAKARRISLKRALEGTGTTIEFRKAVWETIMKECKIK